VIQLPAPLKVPSPQILSEFKFAILEYYKDPKKNQYDPQHLWDTYRIYFNFLRIYADPRITQVTVLQWQADEIHIKESETIDWRTRRGGKSIMLSRFAPFFALIEFGKYEGQVIYRCPYADQLQQFKFWLHKIPFVSKITQKPPLAHIVGSLAINMNVYSAATSASAGGSVFLADEGKKIDIGSALQDYYIEARGMFIEDEPEHKRIIHASTGGDLTQFALDLNRLETKQDKLGRPLVVRMPWTLCPWITQAAIDEELALNLDAPWYVDQEYNCINVPKTGYFFDQDKLKILGKDVPMTYFDDLRLTPNVSGLDWNGKVIGHILYEGHWDGQDLYLFKQYRFTNVPDVKVWLDAHAWMSNEVEGKPSTMGFNAGYSDHLMSLGAQCSYQNWEGNTKDQRLALLQRATIYTHPDNYWFIRNWKEATFKKSLVPQLDKTSTQHGLDCGLHMINNGGAVDVAQKPNGAMGFQQTMEMMQYRR